MLDMGFDTVLMYEFYLFIYSFIHSLFNDTVSTSNYISLNDRIINQ